jgi:hypothetical protein
MYLYEAANFGGSCAFASKKLIADTEMTMDSRAVIMIKTDFITVIVALAATAKSA